MAGVLLVAGHRRDLPDLQYLDAPVRPLPDLDRDVPRAERAVDSHSAVLLVDLIDLQLCRCSENKHRELTAARRKRCYWQLPVQYQHALLLAMAYIASFLVVWTETSG